MHVRECHPAATPPDDLCCPTGEVRILVDGEVESRDRLADAFQLNAMPVVGVRGDGVLVGASYGGKQVWGPGGGALGAHIPLVVACSDR